jgi:hypothetical protein
MQNAPTLGAQSAVISAVTLDIGLDLLKPEFIQFSAPIGKPAAMPKISIHEYRKLAIKKNYIRPPRKVIKMPVKIQTRAFKFFKKPDFNLCILGPHFPHQGASPSLR